ncbi:hypothetical protein BS333_20810 (plasmid) [Vibrio azureus]|uniref:Uncharacterized protein n=1 Tax=Vibrio azureus NBRC 104587 TaxID=1219077 RepID=U3APU0_9VIBR|nr:hypothetical protein [Vibrio azureus]AUI88819.1 hypothetical protein BS333_20810 [Vibrio azureus]GAD75292.1 hypothetical protein VAZ01S_023_00590 [Vibrio azureus NBRC 104587]
MSLKTLSILLSTVSLTACVNAPKQDYIHLPYDNAHSEAYNIAKQTSLSKDYWYGSTIKSPLKDFTPAEIESAETSLREYRGGNVSLGNGLLSIATGDLTGIITVAGGSVANLAQSGHTPSNQIRLLVELPKSEYASNLEAEKFIVTSMKQAGNHVLSQYGQVTQISPKPESAYDAFWVEKSGKSAPFSLVNRKESKLNGEFIAEAATSIDGKNEVQLTYGIIGDSGVAGSKVIVKPPMPFVYSVEVSPIDTVEFYKEYSAQLPEGFYIYVPSFPKTSWNGKTYVDNSVIVPSIFTQGQQYQFIKP